MDKMQLRAQLKAKVDAGTITPAEAAEAMRLWEKRQAAGVDNTAPVALPSVDIASTAQDMVDNPYAPPVLQPESATLERLKLDPNAAAIAEIEKRAEIEGLSFFETLTNTDALSRIGSAALKGPSQMVNAVTTALPGFALMGIGGATGSETAGNAADNSFEEFFKTNQRINDNFGSSDAITPFESFAETASSALVPGGPLASGLSMGVDFAVDQTIREITDVDTGPQQTQYETAFDKAGLGFDIGLDNVPALVAAPLIAFGAYSIFNSGAVKAMRNKVVVKPPTMADVHDFDRFAPSDLVSIETSADARMAYLVDQQTALTNVVTRAGVPDPKLIEDTVSLNTHSAGNTRAREALNFGHLEVDGQVYNVTTTPKVLFEAAQKLPQEVNLAVQKYINIRDMIDDARIAITKELPGNHIQQLGILTAQMRRIERQYPIATKFHAKYKDATAAVRDFLEGDILDTAKRQYLDANRPNYVPGIFNEVDRDAPFVERLIATQRDGSVEPDDWFLMDRNSKGDYDVNARGNPFEGLASMTEASLRLGMKNHTRLRLIDALLASNMQNAAAATNKNLIRLVDDTDDLAGNVDRLVKVYRDGKTETYITSKLTANMLKFDPYLAKHPALFVPKRVAEWAMVGPGSLVFAPITAIRDAIGGYVMAPKGLKVGNPLQVAAAIPKQLWAKGQKALAENLEASLLSGNPLIPINLMSEQSQRNLAGRLSHYYINSIYHQANAAGGFDASLMKNNIVAAQNMLGEVKRTIRDGSFANSAAMTNVVSRFGIGGANAIIDGFVALFDSISDAPRFAALEKTVKSGVPIEDATLLARQLTGDTGRSGMVYNPDGLRMGFDATDRGVATLATPGLGAVGNIAQESITFINPMIQGSRRFINSFREDPSGTMMRSWLAVGLPAVTMYGWNEMLGPEYNDYAMSRRSSNDVAGNLYIGVPGMPPEQGIEIPIPHELQLFGAPYARLLHAITRGEEQDTTSAAMQSMTAAIFSNTLSLSSPVVFELGANAAGVNIDGFLGMGDSYQIRDDNVGFLPQNIETMVRTQFANVGNMALQIMYSMSGEDSKYGPINDFITTVVDDVARRAPVVRNLTGRKSANVSFSIPNDYDKAKARAMDEIMPYWELHFSGKYQNEDGITMPGSKGKYTNAEGLDEGRDLPFTMIGPDQLEKPTNPFYPMFGETLKKYIDNNGIGFSGLNNRDTIYRRYVRQLRGYNAGDREQIAEWQASLADIKEPKSEETAKLQELISQYDLDLESYQDRVKLMNLIENERSFIIQQKLDTISYVEETISQALRKQGLIGADDHFRIDKHMKPFDEMPLGVGVTNIAAAFAQPWQDMSQPQ